MSDGGFFEEGFLGLHLVLQGGVVVWVYFVGFIERGAQLGLLLVLKIEHLN